MYELLLWWVRLQAASSSQFAAPTKVTHLFERFFYAYAAVFLMAVSWLRWCCDMSMLWYGCCGVVKMFLRLCLWCYYLWTSDVHVEVYWCGCVWLNALSTFCLVHCDVTGNACLCSLIYFEKHVKKPKHCCSSSLVMILSIWDAVNSFPYKYNPFSMLLEFLLSCR